MGRPVDWEEGSERDAIAALAARLGLPVRTSEPLLGASPGIDGAAASLGLEAEPCEAPYAEVDSLLRRGAPAIVCRPGARKLTAVVRVRGTTAMTLAPDGGLAPLGLEDLRAALCADVEAPRRVEVDRLLEAAGVPADRRPRAGAALLREMLVGARVGGVWRVRLPAGAPFGAQLSAARLPRRVGLLMLLFALQYAAWIGSWWLLGRWALEGGLGFGWLVAWSLLLLAIVPMRLGATWLQGRVAIEGGGLLKARLLAGALATDADGMRSDGAGRLLGRVLESEAVESLSLTGGVLGLVAGMEIVASACVLSAAPSAVALLGVFAVWLAAGAWLALRFLSARRAWTDERLSMTHALVERMTGHRTRLAQESPERWHDGEAEALGAYARASARMDLAATLLSLVPRAWLFSGACVLAPSLASGGARAAVGLGGVFLAYRALQRGVAGLGDLATAAIAWREVAPLFRAAARPAFAGPSTVASGAALIEARDVVFRHRGRSAPVLAGVSLAVREGDRVLLEGPSGAGKSTLAALLAGLRVPESGSVVVARRGVRVASVPQFHENHVMTGPVLFNLLMGRAWPPRSEDVRDAQEVCGELGLGGLLASMPSGIQQVIGDGGWQLSHGERSRLYLARALLQGSDVLLLDESFAALDPESLRQAMSCVLRRVPTVLLIAHP